MATNHSVLTVEAIVHAPLEKVWEYWTVPDHITKWSTPSDDWHTTYAENDLRVGGKFVSRMEAKDGSYGFDFGGVYDEVRAHEFISYTLGDGRKVEITFIPQENARGWLKYLSLKQLIQSKCNKKAGKLF